MKRAAASSHCTLLFVGARRIARADFDGELRVFNAGSRDGGVSAPGAVSATLALGGKTRGPVWVLCEDVWTQKITLNPAQFAGLSTEQLGRALSFEVEPFSGISIAEGVVGFHHNGGGSFTVVEMPRTERDEIERAIKESGGKLAGITHADNAPEGEESLRTWLRNWQTRLQTEALPLITPPAPSPSRHRFVITSIALEAAALLIILSTAGWMKGQRKELERRNPEFAAASREAESVNKQVATLKAELAALEKEQGMRERVVARRGAILSLLNGLAVTRPEDVVVRSIQAEGPSSLIISGLSLEADAVDEMSIVLSQSLRTAGWIAQPRHKTGKKHLPSGGPWEFSLVITHEEASRVQPMQISQRSPE